MRMLLFLILLALTWPMWLLVATYVAWFASPYFGYLKFLAVVGGAALFGGAVWVAVDESNHGPSAPCDKCGMVIGARHLTEGQCPICRDMVPCRDCGHAFSAAAIAWGRCPVCRGEVEAGP